MAESVRIRIERWTDSSDGPEGCWPWLGWGTKAKNGGGSPTIGIYVGRRKYRTVSARRWLWEDKNGPLLPELIVTTSCSTDGCMNPAHAVVRGRSDQARAVAHIGMCRSGRHDLTDPANIRQGANGVRQGCLLCLREKQRAYSAAEVADGRLAARKRRRAA